jgi:hypothetical protein
MTAVDQADAQGPMAQPSQVDGGHGAAESASDDCDRFHKYLPGSVYSVERAADIVIESRPLFLPARLQKNQQRRERQKGANCS